MLVLHHVNQEIAHNLTVDLGLIEVARLNHAVNLDASGGLTNNLRALEDYSIAHREVYAEVPPRVEYSLTDLGKTLMPVIDAMRAWGEGYKERLRPQRE